MVKPVTRGRRGEGAAVSPVRVSTPVSAQGTRQHKKGRLERTLSLEDDEGEDLPLRPPTPPQHRTTEEEEIPQRPPSPPRHRVEARLEETRPRSLSPPRRRDESSEADPRSRSRSPARHRDTEDEEVPIKYRYARTLQQEYQKVPRSYALPIFDGRPEKLFSFFSNLEHTFESWDIDPAFYTRFAQTQVQDGDAQAWMRTYLAEPGNSREYEDFKTAFTTRFAAKDIQLETTRELRDLRQTSTPAAYATAFQRTMEKLRRYKVVVPDHTLRLFLQLGATDRLANAVDWPKLGSIQDALDKVAALRLGHEPSRNDRQPQQDRVADAPQRSRFQGKGSSRDPPPWRSNREGGDQPPSNKDLTCYNCGEAGHKKVDCPKRSNTGVPFNGGRGHSSPHPKGQRPRDL
jgi:hypothetical protein